MCAATRGTTGFSTILKTGNGGTKATSDVGTSNSALTITAQSAGTAGNSITLEIDTSVASTTIQVSVTGTAITVIPVGNGTTATSTAKEVIEAINASDDAWALVYCQLPSTSDGSGVIAVYSATALTGGVDEVFEAIAEVKDIQPCSLSGEIADATHNQSPGAYREKLITFLDSGQCTFTCNFLVDNPNHRNLFNLFEARQRVNFQIHWPNLVNTVWQFTGNISGITPSVPMADMITADVTIDITGQIDVNV